ncbi:MAG TPA: (Fe-S)-binding protein [Candidatus Brocadiia bacterium]|nr:(Fe-S)-binding protein [Candidatus Brocadiales bacterium]
MVMNKNWELEASKCAKCGKCRSVCPVFLETGNESMVARGRISLAEAIRDNEIIYTKRLKEHIYSCKKCLRCVHICPSGVDYELIIQAMLDGIAENMGIPLLPKIIFRYFLPRRKLFDLLIKGASIFQKFIPGKRRGHMRHLPLLFTGKRWMPPLAPKTALQIFKQIPRLKNPKMRVAFFTGCLINYVYPDIAKAVVDVLNRLNIEVVVPSDQLCCGIPARSLGDSIAARALAERNKNVFESVRLGRIDAIVTACATCGQTLKRDYIHLLGDSWQTMAKKIYDISEFIEKFTHYETKPLGQQVTYHDPCHLYWAQNISREPRNILKRSANYVEMENAERCCGGGGIFSLTHYDLSLKINEHKMESIKETGADIVATNCPGCMMQISDGLAARNMPKKMLHTIQVLQMAMRNGKISR